MAFFSSSFTISPSGNNFTDMAYDATMILALAIAKAGSTEGVAIRDAIREVANAPGVDVGKDLLRQKIALNYVTSTKN
ncbi:MAG: hypothetical protein F6K31_06585 [Symploca sp. SIO2G7]|nr:hypothetical protein [Symploca sp. SIO2G7]